MLASEKTTERYTLLNHWLQKCGFASYSLFAMQGDASFRRYYRIHQNELSYVVMDDPSPEDKCRHFVAIADALRHLGLYTPQIFASDFKHGLLLLSDFGDLTFLKALHANNANLLYNKAISALIELQTCKSVPNHQLPFFTGDFMWQEWRWFKEWFLEKLMGLYLTTEQKELETCFAAVVASAVAQPQVFMHRDYHSANLMVLPLHEVGILDFQDAFIGPLTYDLVSLLRDCYIDWPDHQVQGWALSYWQQLQNHGQLQGVQEEEFLRWFDLMGVERHLKALFTFSRKAIRDLDIRYLQAVPRTLHYLLTVSAKYSELFYLHAYIKEQIMPRMDQTLASYRGAR